MASRTCSIRPAWEVARDLSLSAIDTATLSRVALMGSTSCWTSVARLASSAAWVSWEAFRRWSARVRNASLLCWRALAASAWNCSDWRDCSPRSSSRRRSAAMRSASRVAAPAATSCSACVALSSKEARSASSRSRSASAACFSATLRVAPGPHEGSAERHAGTEPDEEEHEAAGIHAVSLPGGADGAGSGAPVGGSDAA